MKSRLTQAAAKDIREIAVHIRVSQRSPQNAKLVVSRLKEQFRRLAEMPSLAARGESPAVAAPRHRAGIEASR